MKSYSYSSGVDMLYQKYKNITRAQLSPQYLTAEPQTSSQPRKLKANLVVRRFSIQPKGFDNPDSWVTSYEKSEKRSKQSYHYHSNENPVSRKTPQPDTEKSKWPWNFIQCLGYGFSGYRASKPTLTSRTSSEFNTFPSFCTISEIFLYRSTGNRTVVVTVAGPFFLPRLLFFKTSPLYIPLKIEPKVHQTGTFCQIRNNYLILLNYIQKPTQKENLMRPYLRICPVEILKEELEQTVLKIQAGSRNRRIKVPNTELKIIPEGLFVSEEFIHKKEAELKAFIKTGAIISI